MEWGIYDYQTLSNKECKTKPDTQLTLLESLQEVLSNSN